MENSTESTAAAFDYVRTTSPVHPPNKGSSWLASIQDWIDHDPNQVTAAHVEQLLLDVTSSSSDNGRLDVVVKDDDAGQSSRAILSTLFPTDMATRIAFGTAGLRAAMRPGPLHMNDLVVIQTAQGIARYCQRQWPPSRKQRRMAVVIGYDHRACDEFQLSSLQFALLTTLVFQTVGCFGDVLLLDGYVATPMIPFTVYRQTPPDTCCIGIMITASHNPKQDAGYKVYWTNGCQIRSPTDKGIADCINENLVPWIDYRQALEDCKARVADSHNPNDPCLRLSQVNRTQSIISAYYEALLSSGICTNQAAKWDQLRVAAETATPTPRSLVPPKFCYTAMHGVGTSFARRAFETFGLPPFSSVPIQQEPDPNFPSVPFPNPEELGALNLAKAHAEAHGCDVVMANDPDADRLAVAERDRITGTWTVFTGDQIGAMLGHWLWQSHINNESDSSSNQAEIIPAMCASTVSSQLLAEIARVEGFHYEDTLTGFKWIGSRAAELHHQAPTPKASATKSNRDENDKHETRQIKYRTLFCYEEAIGFCCGNVIFDKDGISACAVFAELCYSVYSRGSSMRQHMQSLYDKYGEFVSNNGYFFVSDPTVVSTIMNQITNNGAFDTLETVGPYRVESIRYLGEPGYDSTTHDKKPTLPCSKSSPMITLRFANGCVAQFRGSGTEPKFKYYVELKGQPGVSREAVAETLQQMTSIVLDKLLQPEKNGLSRSKL
jgi:phosphomannomutase